MALAVGILTGMSIVKAYCLVAFRLHFNSKKLLLVNLLTALGYVVGMGVAFASGFWPFVFILGEAFASHVLHDAQTCFRTVWQNKAFWVVAAHLCVSYSEQSHHLFVGVR